MIAVSFDFIAGKYHATPWARHVNEGAIEWPPSPWRILRALIAIWKRTLPDLPQAEVENIFKALAQPPQFFLPPATTGHKRHYMPLNVRSRKLVIDAFVAISKASTDPGSLSSAPVLACWHDASLTTSETRTLQLLLQNLNYLGRAESWCIADLVEVCDANLLLNCVPMTVPASEAFSSSDSQSESEIVYVLCADSSTAFLKYATATGSQLFDPAWNICVDNIELQDKRLSDPPGAQWVSYSRPRDSFQIKARSPRNFPGKPRHMTQIQTSSNTSLIQTSQPPVMTDAGSAPRFLMETPQIQVVRFLVDGGTSGADLPSVTATLPLAESARRAVMGIYGDLMRLNGVKGKSPVFAGKDTDGVPLTGHRHAYYLPSDDDGDGLTDHLTVCSEDGFDDDELRALEILGSVQIRTPTKSRHRMRLLLLDTGKLDDYDDGLFGSSCEWASSTPYISTRHPKSRGKHRLDMTSIDAQEDFLRADLHAQLASFLLRRSHMSTTHTPSPLADPLIGVSIEPIWSADSPVKQFAISGPWQPKQFVRTRLKYRDTGGILPSGSFKLRFSKPIKGPVSLGFSSHFGMGLFAPLC